jgi:hypothetical protein
MAAGAVVGAAAGLYLGRRYRSMDAFVEDMRDKFESVRDVWYEAELFSKRADRLAVDEDGDRDEYDDDLDDDDLDEEYETEEAYHEEIFDDEGDLEDDLEDDLATVGRDEGVSAATKRAADAARQIEERVLAMLRDDLVLGSRDIEIAVVGDGVVELTGDVQTIEEVSRAAAAIRGIPGVSMVLNRLEVRQGGSIETASVAREPSEST